MGDLAAPCPRAQLWPQDMPPKCCNDDVLVRVPAQVPDELMGPRGARKAFVRKDALQASQRREWQQEDSSHSDYPVRAGLSFLQALVSKPRKLVVEPLDPTRKMVLAY